MQRPNLSSEPFANTRPIWVTALVLAVLSVAATTLTVAEYVGKRGEEHAAASRLQQLEARRATLASQVQALNGELSRVSWGSLAAETSSLGQVVAHRSLSWTLMLGDLERVLPWNVRLVSISPSLDNDGHVRLALRGVATDREAWLSLLARLFTDAHFSDPVPISEEAPGPTNSEGHRFQVTVRYWPVGRQ